MDDLSGYSLKVKNFKCFAEEPQGFDSILPFNIIVGRNNAGKSSLIDVVEYIATGEPTLEQGRGKVAPEVLCSKLFDERLFQYLPVGQYDGIADSRSVGERYLKDRITTFRLPYDSLDSLVEVHGIDPSDPMIKHIKMLAQFSYKHIKILRGKHFRRLSADRNIVPEKNPHPTAPLVSTELAKDGTGATTIIGKITTALNLHDMTHPDELVKHRLIEELNRIYALESHFTDIKTKAIEGPSVMAHQMRYEIVLVEKTHGPMVLSQTGSGLKTIILVLLNTIIYPKLIGKLELRGCIFAFEELENNLHPAIQRRLFQYLRNLCKTEGCRFFITTHSNVVIDMFGKDKDAQILHITHDRTSAKVTRVSTYVGKRNILTDLDVRASDLLQSNAVVWVEGPSDRIYFNRWISLWDSDLQEMTHYQVLYTAGSLLEGMSFGDPQRTCDLDAETLSNEDVSEFIEALTVNKNAIVIMDRDRGPDEDLKPWVVRIKQSVESMKGSEGMHGMAWITDGREVENYIPTGALDIMAASNEITFAGVNQPGQFDRFFEIVLGPKRGDLSGKKPAFAKLVSPRITREMLENVPGLPAKLDAACSLIRKWNGLPPKAS